LAWIVRIGLAAGLPGLCGCAYSEALAHRQGAPDTRIRLPSDGSPYLLSEQDIEKYTCVANMMLTCERGGAVKSSCWCALR
jgi:hypothetical protein